MRPRKTPSRPAHDITQAFNDGILTVYTVEDTAQPGRMPVKGLKQLVSLRYEERKMGIQRYYSGLQNQMNISRVVRVPSPPMELTSQCVAITEKGTKYNIRMVQFVRDVYPPCYDLTLERISQTEEEPL